MSVTPFQHNLIESGIVPVLMAKGRRSRILIIGDHDLSPLDTQKNGLDAWYTRSRPASKVLGYFRSGSMTGSIGPISTSYDNPPGIQKGSYIDPFRWDGQPFPPYPGYVDGSELNQIGWFYNPSASAGYGYGYDYYTDYPGGYLIPCGSQEFIWGQTAGASAGQTLAHFTLQRYNTSIDDWSKDELRAKFFWHEPRVYPLGGETAEKPILGGPSLMIGSWRGSTGSVYFGDSAIGATSNTIRCIGITIPPSSDYSMPNVGVFATGGTSSYKKRMIPVGCVIESNTATEGLSIFCIGNPWADAYQYSLLSPGIKWERMEGFLNNIGPIDAVIVILGSFLTIGGISPFYAENDVISDLINSGENYKNLVSENMNDMLRSVTTHLTNPNIPVLLVTPRFAGAGTDLTESKYVYSQFVKSYVYESNTPTDLKWGWPRTAVIDYYSATSPESVMTLSGSSQLIREVGQNIIESDWNSSTVYSVGDIVNYSSIDPHPSPGNSRKFICVTGHSGHAPPDTNYWNRMTFVSSPTGSSHMVDFIWDEIRTAWEILEKREAPSYAIGIATKSGKVQLRKE